MLQRKKNVCYILIFLALICCITIVLGCKKKDSIVFGNIAAGKAVFINIDTGKTIAPIPTEYEIIPQSHYLPFSDTILLQKSNDLCAFSCSSSTITLLKNDFASAGSEIYSIQSISDDSMYIIYSYSDNEGQFGESYFLNSTDNSIEKTSDSIDTIVRNETKQIVYDSKGNALYTWNVGEGIYVPLPIERIDITTNEVKETITEESFSDDPLFNIDYYAEFLIGTPKNYEITKEMFIYSIKKGTLEVIEINGNNFEYCYSAIYQTETNRLYLGTRNDIKLLKLDNGVIVEAAKYEDNNGYLNSMYLIDNRLIYQAKDGIVILNSQDLTRLKVFSLAGINKMNFLTEFGIYSMK